MKKRVWISFLIISILLFTFTSCTKESDEEKAVKHIIELSKTENYEEKIEVFSSLPLFDDFYHVCKENNIELPYEILKYEPDSEEEMFTEFYCELIYQYMQAIFESGRGNEFSERFKQLDNLYISVSRSQISNTQTKSNVIKDEDILSLVLEYSGDERILKWILQALEETLITNVVDDDTFFERYGNLGSQRIIYGLLGNEEKEEEIAAIAEKEMKDFVEAHKTQEDGSLV